MKEVHRFFRLLIDRFVSVRAPLIAGSLAFTTMLSLVPMIAVALTVMGQLPVFQSLGRTFRGFLLQNFLPDKAGKVVTTYALQFSQKAESLTLVGSMVLIVTAVLMLLTIDRTFNAIWEVRRPRPLWTRLALYWLGVTLGPVMIALSVSLTVEFARYSLDVVSPSGGFDQTVQRVLSGLLFSAFFGFMYFAVPNRRIVPWHAAIGGFITGFGLVLLQRLLGYYVGRFTSYTLIYGTFSAVPIFLVWLYASWLVVLIGALIAAVIPDFLAQRRLLPPTVAGRFYAASRLATALRQAQINGRVETLEHLADVSRQRIEETEAMLNAMRECGWVAETDEGDWLLVGDGAELDAAKLFRRFVLPLQDLERLSAGSPPEEQAEMREVWLKVDAALAKGQSPGTAPA